MATVTGTLKMFDAMTGPLKSITSGMNLMVSSMYKMQDATSRNNNIDKTLAAAKNQIASAEVQINRAIEQSTRSQNNFEKSVSRSHKSSNQLLSAVKSIGAAYLTWQTIKQAIQITDEYTNTNARLNLINDKLLTTKELQEKVFAAAQRSRGSYFDMAKAIGKMGLLAKDAFKNNQELVDFTELMQKSFRISGASTMEQQAGMYQLTQAMAAGKLQGDEFRSIMENAPMLAEAIAKYTGKTKGELKKMSADGTITANIIKGAMFKAADDINKKFSQMPKTFGDYFNSLKNIAIQSFAPLMTRLNAFINSPSGKAFFSSMEKGIVLVSRVLQSLVDGFVWLTQVIQYNWPIIAGILAGVGVILAVMAYQSIPLLITRLWLMIEPIMAQAAAWLAVNWPIALVALGIGLIVAALVHFGVSTQEVVGYVTGAFYTMFSVIYNKVALVWNVFASFAEFLINLFIDPVYAVKKLFYDLATTFGNYIYNMARSTEDFAGIFVKAILKAVNKALEGFNWLADKVNDTFGTDIGKMALLDENNVHVVSDSLKNMMDMLDKPTSTKNVVSIKRMEQMNMSDSFKKGYSAGYGFADKAINKINNFTKGLSPATGKDSFLGGKGKLPNIDKVNKVGKIEDKVDISSEDLKLMRELAEMKTIQNFVSLTPTVSVSTGPINQGADFDQIVAKIETVLEESITAHAAGVYK
ncbi:tape measure protein [Paenibacillus puldeungensis]|uniref:Tape measure protein n=1 Tax=Paenibacillus puldeungensis TaxID=696536 RepID=A0ABW3S343_9BACL